PLPGVAPRKHEIPIQRPTRSGTLSTPPLAAPLPAHPVAGVVTEARLNPARTTAHPGNMLVPAARTHRLEHRIHARVVVCWLALLLIASPNTEATTAGWTPSGVLGGRFS